MANLSHNRIVFLNQFVKDVERALNRHTERWEDINEEIVFSVKDALVGFHKRVESIETKNQLMIDRANHKKTNTSGRTVKSNNRLSNKRRKTLKII